MGKAVYISQHAIDRYMERSGSKRPVRTIGKLFNVADRAVQIGRNKFYAQGWIIVLKEGEIKTAYKPRSRREFMAIYMAINKVPNNAGTTRSTSTPQSQSSDPSDS